MLRAHSGYMGLGFWVGSGHYPGVPSQCIMHTMGPKVYKCYLHGAIWSLRVRALGSKIPLKEIEHGVYGDFIKQNPKTYLLKGDYIVFLGVGVLALSFGLWGFQAS